MMKARRQPTKADHFTSIQGTPKHLTQAAKALVDGGNWVKSK